MKRHAQHEELVRLISGLLDQRLSPEEHTRLESLLASDPDARQLYMQMIDQEVELPCLLATHSANEKIAESFLRARPHGSLVHHALSLLRPKWGFAAAACAVVLAVFLAQRWSNEARPPERKELASSTPEGATMSWSEDFEDGQLSGWFGTLVTTNLPTGSKFAITTAIRVFPGDNRRYQIIQLPESWNDGLFVLTNGSTLHLTYWLGKPSLLNVFMHTLRPNPMNPQNYDMFHLRSSILPAKVRQWQTASIPFAQFVRKIIVEPGGSLEFAGGPPEPGELVTTLSFSSPDPIDLVIDSVWVTPTGTGREESHPHAVR